MNRQHQKHLKSINGQQGKKQRPPSRIFGWIF